MAIKGQALAGFIAEFTYTNTAELTGTTDITEAVKVVDPGRKELCTPERGR